jgi:hypothetical protein
MKTVGTRRADGEALVDQGPLARTAAILRGARGLARTGVYRFTSFDEAESWMQTEMRRTREPQSQPISPASAAR